MPYPLCLQACGGPGKCGTSVINLSQAFKVTVTDASWPHELPPTRDAALARIAAVRPDAYARTRNALDGAVTGLSPYLTHGLVTLPEVLAGVLEREPLPAGHKLLYEFGWREYFRHVWAHEGDGILASLHAGPLPDDAYSSVLPADIREGRTGVPVIDQAVRTLYATGRLHNHARMWLASYVVHLRHIHWRAGADWMLAHLFDGDRASNHLSWQWVAGTASHKPYLFNADNVARFAPGEWHSPGSVIDQSYTALEQHARDAARLADDHCRAGTGPGPGLPDEYYAEPTLYARPPERPGLHTPDSPSAEIAGREVWLVHPWALRQPPTSVPDDALLIGVYLTDYHQAWPWPEARWRWVDSAMAASTAESWVISAAELTALLAPAALVRSIDNPHIGRLLRSVAQLDPEPLLFPVVEQRCSSFSQWWKHATRGLERAEELV